MRPFVEPTSVIVHCSSRDTGDGGNDLRNGAYGSRDDDEIGSFDGIGEPLGGHVERIAPECGGKRFAISIEARNVLDPSALGRKTDRGPHQPRSDHGQSPNRHAVAPALDRSSGIRLSWLNSMFTAPNSPAFYYYVPRAGRERRLI